MVRIRLPWLRDKAREAVADAVDAVEEVVGTVVDAASPASAMSPLRTGALVAITVLVLWLLVRLLRRPAKVDPTSRWVLVTGADSGLGRELVVRARAAGFEVLAATLTLDGAKSLKDVASSTVVADLTTSNGISAVLVAVQRALAKQGSKGLWALVNNAGCCLPGNIEWLHPSSYDKTIELNFLAPVRLVYSLLPLLKSAKGRVVNITSVDGFIALPTNAAYNASKHALEAYSDTLRCEMLPWGVKVVVIEPATMRTPLALSFADGWLSSYLGAPLDRRTPYGDEWANRIAKGTKEGIEGIAADPVVTVDAMLSALVEADPPSRMATGKAANLLFKPLSMLPDKTRDALLYQMSFPGAPPGSLAKS